MVTTKTAKSTSIRNSDETKLRILTLVYGGSLFLLQSDKSIQNRHSMII